MGNSPGESFRQFIGDQKPFTSAQTNVQLDSVLPSLPFGSPLSDSPLTDSELRAISAISLAYIGDAVFELYVRSRLLIPAKRIRDYHQQVVAQVKAEQQSRFVDILSPHLTDAERALIRRGRNATTGKSRRANSQDYQKATGLEALIGFLYLTDQPRLLSLLDQLRTQAES